MEIITDFFKTTFNFISDVLDGAQRLLLPQDIYSWQTLIYLSIFSLLMSYWAQGTIVKNIIALCGWFFLILGTSWYTTDKPVLVPGTIMSVGALVTGALVSVFAFGDEQNIFNQVSFVLWPTISAMITAIPEFFQGTGTNVSTQIPKPEARQKIIVLIVGSILVSCWLQVYFLVDSWVKDYPSLLNDNVNNSILVKELYPIENLDSNKAPKNGSIILNKLALTIIDRIDKRPWYQVEILLKNMGSQNSEINKLGGDIIAKELGKYKEKDLWRVEARVDNINPNNPDTYKLDLLSIWSGPTSKVYKNPRIAVYKPYEYYLKRSCRVEPIVSNLVKIADIQCENVNNFFNEPPPSQR